MKKLLYIFLFLSLVLAACDSDKSDVISSGKMEDILYDFHLAQGMSGEGTPEERALVEIRNRETILRKYGVTDAEWDSSYNYYCRHSQELYDIYKNLSDRVRNEVVAMGGSVSAVGDELLGDTTNVWNTDRDFILMQKSPYNVKSFNIVADTTYKAGDRLTMQFNTQYIFQDGMRDLVVMFAVTLGNDSVVTESRHVSIDGINTLSISDSQRLGVKAIRGYFILTRNINDISSTTLRLASVFDVKLIRMHDNKPASDTDKIKSDSANVNGTDSIHQIQNGSQGTQPTPAQPVENPSNRSVQNGAIPAPTRGPLRPVNVK